MMFSKILNNGVHEARSKTKLPFVIVCAKIVEERYRLEATEGRLHILASSTPDLPGLERKEPCRLPCTVTRTRFKNI